MTQKTEVEKKRGKHISGNVTWCSSKREITKEKGGRNKKR